jgi:chromate transporter
VVAVTVQAGVALARPALAGRAPARPLAYAAVGVAATLAAAPLVVVALLGCGAAELSWRSSRAGRAAVHAWPLALLVAARGAAELPPVAWTALKVGGLAFGGGFVIVPLLAGDVHANGWMSDATFANAVAYGQVTPGPVTHTVALIGWAADGLPGALLASAVGFAPSFAFVLLAGQRFDRLRSARGPRAFLDGAGPAAVGAIFGAAALLAGALGPAWQWAVLALAALALALGRPPVLALLGGAVAGVVAAVAGLPI